MKSEQFLLWALGINGEGSARVTFAFIKSICKVQTLPSSKTTILYSSGSTLDHLISSYLQNNISVAYNINVRFVRLPRIARNYLFHFLLKYCAGPFLTYESVVVFDDFPFRFLHKQILYFHQPNLIHNNSLVWRIKRLAFRLLLSPSLTVYIQTNHMRDSFIYKFGFFRTISFLHDLI